MPFGDVGCIQDHTLVRIERARGGQPDGFHLVILRPDAFDGAYQPVKDAGQKRLGGNALVLGGGDAIRLIEGRADMGSADIDGDNGAHGSIITEAAACEVRYQWLTRGAEGVGHVYTDHAERADGHGSLEEETEEGEMLRAGVGYAGGRGLLGQAPEGKNSWKQIRLNSPQPVDVGRGGDPDRVFSRYGGSCR